MPTPEGASTKNTYMALKSGGSQAGLGNKVVGAAEVRKQLKGTSPRTEKLPYMKQQVVGLLSIFGSWLNLLLVFAPLGLISDHMGWGSLAAFTFNFLAIVPLAGILGAATENLAIHVGELLGGLLNATFGNAVEMIITINAIKAGLVGVVQDSLIGSILSNLLLVMGMAFVGSFFKANDVAFNQTGAGANVTCLVLASMALCLPTVYTFVPNTTEADTLLLSRYAALVMATIYMFFLYFQLGTHSSAFAEKPAEGEAAEEEPAEEAVIAAPTAIALLLAATCCVAACSEVLVDSIEGVTEKYGMPQAFIGTILLPIVGNAAEHTTAVTAAVKGKMDLALGVAVGSSTQIGLFVVPFSVIVGWIVDVPMTLNFEVFQSVCFFLSVFIASQVLADGSANWFEGSMLIATYVLVAIVVWFIPDPAESTL
eukprot:TRINITY_DN45450_c0_g1_i1.p1 TRINITY_DN45450_c0_g1~~TRINITY_DN45450_c0_g1_i1.p1  ORF type:complete len:426 (-),score=92.91 TRINITY_DN45450_c0_g1_i1:82-1359(-)